jgi:hypothetical protein|nr:MAG TPA: hypothetical protein [Caudoviricetes sp.]
MTLINDLLKKIKEAIYGEEVRNSIHDAIEQCYKDATGHPESVAATVKEIGEVSANLSKERKRIDNLIATGTAQTQEIGKVIATTSENGAKIAMDYLSEEVTCKKVFTDVTFQDFNFFIVALGTPKGDVAKILKPGLYHMKFCVKVSKDSGLPEIPMKIMLNSSTSPDKGYVTLKREYFVFPQTESKRNMRNVEFVFAITEPTYITISVISVADGQGTFGFSISDCAITALDWKGKQSADLSELHDLRIEAGGRKHDTAKEAINDQLNEIHQQIDAVGIAKNLFINIHVERVRNGITVNMDGHKISIFGTATGDESLTLIAGEISESGLETGRKYFVYGLPTDAFAKFQLKDKTIKEVLLENNSFTIPEDAIQLAFAINVKKGDALDYTGVLRVYEKIYKGSFQEQIDTLNEQINAMQQIITKIVTAPTLTADTNGNLQITENEEG